MKRGRVCHYTATTDRITRRVARTQSYSDGSALVVHACPMTRRPTHRESGGRVAAGVIRESATVRSTAAGGTTTSAPLPKSGAWRPCRGSCYPRHPLYCGLGGTAYAVLRRR